MRRIVFGFCLLPLLCLPAFADQAAWISKKQADAALAVLSEQKEIRNYCEPCGDAAITAETVKDVALSKQSDDYWEVHLNGKGIDLAYVFVQFKGTWVNLARVLDIPVEDVSTLLPESPVATFNDDEYAKLMRSSPAFKAADERLNRAWNAAQPLVPKADKEMFQADQKIWIFGRDQVLRDLARRHKYHQSVPEGILRAGAVDREQAFTFFSETRADLLEQYAKSLGGGRAEFAGVWSAEESDSQARGLLLDDGLTFVYLCGSGELETPPAQIRELPDGERVRISGRMAYLDRLLCADDLRVEKLAPLPKKEPEQGKESAVQLTVIGVLGGGEGDVYPYVTIADGEYFSFDMEAADAKDCRENAEFGGLIEVSGTLTTPARGLPFFDPKMPTACARLMRIN